MGQKVSHTDLELVLSMTGILNGMLARKTSVHY